MNAPAVTATPTVVAVRTNRSKNLILPPDISDEVVAGLWSAAKATGRTRITATTIAQHRGRAPTLVRPTNTGTPISAWTIG